MNLEQAVTLLTRDHPVAFEDSFKIEISLLEQLRGAFTERKAGATTNSSLKSQRALYSLNASEIWQEIATETDRRWRGAGRPALARTPLAERIQDVAKHTADKAEFHALVLGWIDRIRDCFTSSTDLIGGCPECGESEFIRVDPVDGSRTRRTALKRTVNAFEADCRLCEAHYEGIDEMIWLSDNIIPVGKAA